MTNIPEGITQQDLDRLAILDKGLKVLQDEQKDLKDKIKTAFENAHLGKGTYLFPSEASGRTVAAKITPTARLSADGKAALEERFPLDKSPEVWTSQLDLKKIDKKIVDSYKDTSLSLSIDLVD